MRGDASTRRDAMRRGSAGVGACVEECGAAAVMAVRGGGAWLACLWRALGWLWETVSGVEVSSENEHGKIRQSASWSTLQLTLQDLRKNDARFSVKGGNRPPRHLRSMRSVRYQSVGRCFFFFTYKYTLVFFNKVKRKTRV